MCACAELIYSFANVWWTTRCSTTPPSFSRIFMKFYTDGYWIQIFCWAWKLCLTQWGEIISEGEFLFLSICVFTSYVWNNSYQSFILTTIMWKYIMEWQSKYPVLQFRDSSLVNSDVRVTFFAHESKVQILWEGHLVTSKDNGRFFQILVAFSEYLNFMKK